MGAILVVIIVSWSIIDYRWNVRVLMLCVGSCELRHRTQHCVTNSMHSIMVTVCVKEYPQSREEIFIAKNCSWNNALN